MSIQLAEPAPAKLNWTLRITGKRADDYHTLHSYVFFAPHASDILTFQAASSGGIKFAMHADGYASIPSQENIVLSAVKAMEQRYDRICHGQLTLHKRLPVAAGLGGGSSDAAAAIRLLHRHWRISEPLSALTAWSAQLGADVPVCLNSHWCLMSGIGETLTPLPHAPACWPNAATHIVIVTPPIHVPTVRIFSALTPDDWGSAANDLQQMAIKHYPEIQRTLTWLDTHTPSLASRMSGSGGSCFALFDSHSVAAQAQRNYQSWQPQGWSAISTIR